MFCYYTVISDQRTRIIGDRILKNGKSGADVRELQTMLLQLGYNLGSWGVDGDFGDCTEMAVRAFQKNARVEVDGEVGPITLAALYAALEAQWYAST